MLERTNQYKEEKTDKRVNVIELSENRSVLQGQYVAQRGNQFYSPNFDYKAPTLVADSKFDLPHSPRSMWSPKPLSPNSTASESLKATNTVETNAWSTLEETKPDSRFLDPNTGCTCSAALFIGLAMGFLVGGTILAIVMTLWLAPGTTIISTTTVMTTVITIVTTTATTTTATTTTTASTTPAPLTVCPTSNATGGTYLSSGTPLFSTYQVTVTCGTYLEIAWLYVAQSANETLTISIYNSPGWTYVDDVSIIDMSTSQELISNGGFENGTTDWSGTALAYISQPGGCRTGNWCYYDGSSSSHYVNQTVFTTIGHTLSVSFYIKWSGSGGGIYNYITINP